MLELSHNRSALSYIEGALALCFRPITRLKPSEWANQHRQLSRESSSRPGKWRNLPMQIKPMDDAIDPTVRSVVLQWASQTAGKTEVCNNLVGYFAHQDPSPCMMVQPTLEMAEAWSKDRVMPLFRDTPVLAELNRGNRRKDGTTLHRTFPGGHLTIAGANSPASLASRPIRVTWFDEVDRFPDSAGEEGDPILLTEKRSDTFHNSVSYKTSTPTIRKQSRIEREFLLSDQNYWFVCCESCGHEQKLVWAQLLAGLDEENPENTRYICANEACKARWDDQARVRVIRKGRWVATAPFKGIRGYHLSGLYSLFRAKKGFKHRLHQMAVEYLTAKKLGKESMKVWTNTFLAETWEDEVLVKPEWKTLYNRREKYPLEKGIPKGVILVTFGTDFQADRIELEFVGWGRGEETWGLGHHKIYGDPKNPEIYQRLEAALNRQFIREDGAILAPNAGGFDTGYAAAQRMLYAYLRPRLVRRYYAFKGASKKNAEPISHSSKSKVETVKLLMVGTNRIKTYIYSRATISQPGPQFMHFPEEYGQEFFKQLLAEDSREVIDGSMKFQEFYMPTEIPDGGTDRNEVLDLRVYAQAALYARGVPNWDYEESRNLDTIPKPDTQTIQPTRRRPRGGFVTGVLGN